MKPVRRLSGFAWLVNLLGNGLVLQGDYWFAYSVIYICNFLVIIRESTLASAYVVQGVHLY
jgi:hypothetical protein